MVAESLLVAVLEETERAQTVDPDSGASMLECFFASKNPSHTLVYWLHLNRNPDDTTPPLPATATAFKSWLSLQIASIDTLIEDQLNTILHHEKFQQLEASWRGLELLTAAASEQHRVKIRFLDVSWREIAKDLQRAADFDQSNLFHRIYNDEFGMPGGEPFGILLGNYQVAHMPYEGHPTDDVEVLRGLAQIAAAAFAPFVCGAAPQLFGLDDFDGLGQPLNYNGIFRSKSYLRWNSLRDFVDSRFVGISLPNVLLREPYTLDQCVRKGLNFTESCHSNSDYLWGNACYALGTVVIREYGNTGWFSHIRGVPRDYLSGGLVTSLPKPGFDTGERSVSAMSTSVVITDSAEKSLSDLGFIALCHCYGTPYCAFLSSASMQKPRQFQAKGATANARVSAMLQQILCASRFAHYIKVMIRDKVGSFTEETECEKMLDTWLRNYTTGRDDLSWEMRAKYPLRDFRVQVRGIPGKPGSYSCAIHLKPHYIAEQIISEIKLTTELNQIGTAA